LLGPLGHIRIASLRGGRDPGRVGDVSRVRDLIIEPSFKSILEGDPSLPRKIMPGVDMITTRAGLLIGVMVSLSGPLFTKSEKGFFSLSGAVSRSDA
jgi:hypothetical protein